MNIKFHSNTFNKIYSNFRLRMSTENPPSETENFWIRRIQFDSEIKEFEELQSSATIFCNHYPDHRQWFKHAIEDLKLGKRVAFGIYRPIFKDGQKPDIKLVGSLMLKKKLFSDVVVLKNLFIREENRGKHYGSPLLEHAELYCAKRGFSKIITEVPSNEIDTLNFLLRRNYQVDRTIASPYKRDEYLCQLLKRISPRYHGDSFDLVGLSEWILKNVYGFTNIRTIDSSFFSFDLDLKYHPLEKLDAEIIPHGLAAIYEHGTELNDVLCINLIEKAKNFQICFAFCDSYDNKIEEKLRARGILLFDNKKIKESLKECFAYKPPNFSKEKIAGMVVTIKPDYLNKAIHLKKAFTYFKGGNVGESLKENDHIFFYTDISETDKDAGIKGYGIVKEILPGNSKEIWEEFKDKNPLFEKSDYDKFVEEKGSILAIVVENLQQIDTISLESLEKILGSKIDYEDFNQYYFDHKVLSLFLVNKKDIDANELAFPTQGIEVKNLVKPVSKIDFLIITALQEERDAILSRLDGYSKVPASKDDIYTYFQAELPFTRSDNTNGKYSIRVMLLPEYGQINATLATSAGIRMWNPTKILLVGIAGGRQKENVKLGDILIANQIIDYEIQKQTQEKNIVSWSALPVDRRLLTACENFMDDSWLERIGIDRPDEQKLIRHYGPIASGNKVVAFEHIIEEMGETWVKLKGVEMEAGGSVKAAHDSPGNPGFFMIRCVSDFANEDKGRSNIEQWREYACNAAAEFTISFLRIGPEPQE